MQPWPLRLAGVDWRRIVASGALWMVCYNLIWGAAWFAFMRDEWLAGVVAIGQPLPWTAEVWFVWVLFTLPIGMAIVAYAAARPTPTVAALHGTLAIWLLLQSGLTLWGAQAALAPRLLGLDAAVNLAAMFAASLVAAWSLRHDPIGNRDEATTTTTGTRADQPHDRHASAHRAQP